MGGQVSPRRQNVRSVNCAHQRYPAPPGEIIVVRVDLDDRDVMVELDPKAFFLTDHYRGYASMLVRMAQVRPELLALIFEQSPSARRQPRGVFDVKEPASAPVV